MHHGPRDPTNVHSNRRYIKTLLDHRQISEPVSIAHFLSLSFIAHSVSNSNVISAAIDTHLLCLIKGVSYDTLARSTILHAWRFCRSNSYFSELQRGSGSWYLSERP